MYPTIKLRLLHPLSPKIFAFYNFTPFLNIPQPEFLLEMLPTLENSDLWRWGQGNHILNSTPPTREGFRANNMRVPRYKAGEHFVIGSQAVSVFVYGENVEGRSLDKRPQDTGWL